MATTSALSVPNLITIARILAIPLVLWLVANGDPAMRIVGLLVYILAAASDWVDGYLARKWNQSSPLGRMLDPIADKLLVGLLIVVLAWDASLSALDLVPALAILFREIFIAGLREFLGGSKVVLHVTWLAKWKTTLQLVALAVIILEPLLPVLWPLSDLLLWAAGLVTLWTGLEYFRASWPHLSGEPQ